MHKHNTIPVLEAAASCSTAEPSQMFTSLPAAAADGAPPLGKAPLQRLHHRHGKRRCANVTGNFAGYGSYLEAMMMRWWREHDSNRDAPMFALHQLLRRRPPGSLPDFNREAACARTKTLNCFYEASNQCEHVGEEIEGEFETPFNANAANLAQFWEVAPRIARLLKPNALLERHLAKRRRGIQFPCLAVHMRYGDACGVDAVRTARRCDPPRAYADAARRIVTRYRFGSVLATSDSHAHLDNFRRALGARGGNSSPPVVTTGAMTIGDHLKRETEELRRKNTTSGPTLFDHVISSKHRHDDWQLHLDFLTDLHLMAECDGMVGKFTSNVDRIVLALMAVRRRCVPPYISLDESRWCFNSDTSPMRAGLSRYGRFTC